MSKIPVGATIARAYGFAFRDFFKIVSIVWLPWLFLSAVGIFVGAYTLAFAPETIGGNGPSILSLLPGMIPIYLISLFLLFMQIAGITEQALGLRRGSHFYYLAFGKPVWRLVGAFLLNVLIVLGLLVLFILAGTAFQAALALLGKLAGFGRIISAVTTFATAAAALCAYIYILFRVAFLLNPVVIAESRVALGRSWSLSKGNFWRMFAIFLAVLMPTMVLLGVILYFAYGGFLPLLPANATADQINAHREAVAAWSAAAMNRSVAYWYLIYPAYGVYTVLMYGLGCGAQCFAYRALVPEAPPNASLP